MLNPCCFPYECMPAIRAPYSPFVLYILFFTVTNPLSPNESTDHSTLPKGYDGFNDPKNLKTDAVGFFGRIKKPNLMKVGML